MNIKAIYFDFGLVIGYPKPEMSRKYLYLDWDGLTALSHDTQITPYLRPGIGQAELTAFFEKGLYENFIQHEQSDLLTPLTNQWLLQNLPALFNCPVEPELVDKILSYLNTMKYMTIDPNAAPVLAELKHRGLRLSMISNMMLPGKLLRAKLQEHGLLAYFDTVTISSEVSLIKPHPAIFQQTLAKDGLEAAEVAFVGDTYRQDIIGAKQVGMKTIWLNNRQEIAPGDPPDYEINKLSELTELVNSL